MNKNRYKTIKRLSKAHILPSVFFLFLTLFAAFFAFFLMFMLMLTEILQERLINSCDRAAIISTNIADEKLLPEDVPAKYPEYADGFFLLDPKGAVIFGSGENSFTKDQIVFMDINSNELIDYELIADTTTFKYISKDDSSTLYGITVSFCETLTGDEDIDLNTDIFSLPYWVKDDLPNGNVTMIKSHADIRIRDIYRIAGMSTLPFIAVAIPAIFMFFNVLLGVMNQKRMTKLLFYNTTTEGKSYLYFEHKAGKLLRSTRTPTSHFMFVDLTLMKYRSYCNYHGIHAGEALLESIDKTICGTLRKNEICALAGKSSFSLLLFCKNHELGQKRVDDLLALLSQKHDHSGIFFHAGICYAKSLISRKDKKSMQIELRDPAVYFNCAGAARASIEGRIESASAVYDETLMDEQIWEHRVEEKMDKALENEEFQVYIQPKYDPSNEKLAGAEALVRWINEEDGFISPGKFIPIFEKNGFITKLDDYMLEHVSRLQSEWLKEGKGVVPISVNVSRAHFANPGLADHICSIVDKYEVPHELIEIELTESAFFDDRNMLLGTVHALREMGFEISMDDFGAGYSSLNSLKDLPLDVLKLDADFFRGENSQDRGEIVVSQAISLAKKLNMRIVAEGIEKKEQVDFLAEQGCDMIQGFYFAKPMPAEEYALRLS